MKIQALFIQREKKAPAEQVHCLSVEAQKGIVGDVHADGSDRQISLLPNFVFTQRKTQADMYPCLSKIKVNMVLADFDGAQVGDILQFGDVVLKITHCGRACHNLCENSGQGKFCGLTEHLYFASVETSGTVCTDALHP